MGKERVTLSHLLFANGTTFFFSGEEHSFLLLNHILELFEAMSRLKINRGKC